MRITSACLRKGHHHFGHLQDVPRPRSTDIDPYHRHSHIKCGHDRMASAANRTRSDAVPNADHHIGLLDHRARGHRGAGRGGAVKGAHRVIPFCAGHLGGEQSGDGCIFLCHLKQKSLRCRAVNIADPVRHGLLCGLLSRQDRIHIRHCLRLSIDRDIKSEAERERCRDVPAARLRQSDRHHICSVSEQRVHPRARDRARLHLHCMGGDAGVNLFK